MTWLNEFFKSHPEIRCTQSLSGCPETDSVFPPINVYVGGPQKNAEKLADMCCEEMVGFYYDVVRTGPREIRVTKKVRILHYSDETVSF